jgi:1-acyl-sn-glycerol-3-phosphate acyltransferase
MKPFYRFCHTIVRLLMQILYHHRVYRPKEITQGAAIIAPNHASHLDPPFVGSSWPEEIHFLGRRTLFDHPRLARLIGRLNCHPVNREGADPASLKMILSLLQNHQKVMVFPEGRRTTDGALQPGQAGVAMLALRVGCPVIPTYIHGTFDVWSRHQRRPKLHGKTACVFGEPIYAQEFANLPKKEAQAQMTDRIMAAIAELRDWYNTGHHGRPPGSNLRPR